MSEKLFGSKKGDTKEMIPELFVGLIIVLFISFLLLVMIHKFINSSRFEAKFLAKDIAYLTDTIHAAPNDISIRYPQKTQQFSFRFTDRGQIAVFKGEYSEDKVLATDYFTPTKGIKVKNVTLVPLLEISQNEDSSIIYFLSTGEAEEPEGYVPLKIEKKGRMVEASQAVNIFSEEDRDEK